MALRFCRASVDTPYVLLSTPLMRKLVLSEHTDVPRPCEGSKTLHIHQSRGARWPVGPTDFHYHLGVPAFGLTVVYKGADKGPV